MGDSDDTSVFISSNFIRREFGEHNDTMLPVIVVKPEKGADMAEIKAEISYKLRNFRGVKPDEIDNFFLNVLSGFTDFIDNIVGQLNMVGWIISGFSLLVGGFGIANIMFVSVKERTNLIGIQKSLGAKNKFILFQFLFEAIILAIIGGLIGLFLVWIIALTLTNMLDFEFILSFSNVLLGTSLSAIIGLLSGILPAISAARLDPVEAIRTGI
jgi:putative ABC transport system permease protein